MGRITFHIATFVLLLSCIDVFGKPALNEENRNLCESEDDKAECIKEIEEAKASPVAEENPEESADSEEEPKEEEKMVPEEDHLVMLERVRKESEENRKFWQEEVLAMNKWRRHWLS
ncbi:uncharacterized protein LOC113682026 [Pocillopora damicornis]|uniref:uncharacterized protein LOC113682026 n=1 Tax=Pocillopora damicornis TaxID=46731 RepID=UPI000F54D505|nr:uncharacterized protein LOC113682026 [Pocillopora damicornis]